MSTVVADWVRIGLAAATFILVGKLIFVGYHVPFLDSFFAAV